MPWLAALAPMIGGAIGTAAASGDQSQAQAAYQSALNQMLGVTTPTISQQQVNLQNYQNAGQLTPAMMQAAQTGPNAYNNISVDPRLQTAQMTALSQMGNLANGGLNAQDIAALNNIRNQSAAQATSMNKGVMANMAARGMAGGGAQLASELANNQQAANMAGNASLNVGGQAASRALDALSGYGGMASNIQAQQFNQGAQKAQAQNALAQFNASMKNNANQYNTQAQNQSNLYNMQNQQNVLNANTGVANEQQLHNKGLYQQNFNDQMQKAYGSAGQYGNMGTYFGNQANSTRAAFGSAGQGAGNLIMGGIKASSGSNSGEDQGEAESGV